MTIDTKKLRELLAPLPRVPWGRYKATVVIPETEEYAGKYLSIDGLERQYARHLAAYIAGMNPETVGTLLDTVDAQAAEIVEAKGQIEFLDRQNNALREIARRIAEPGWLSDALQSGSITRLAREISNLKHQARAALNQQEQS